VSAFDVGRNGRFGGDLGSKRRLRPRVDPPDIGGRHDQPCLGDG
jgi:hypothetical protein